VTGATGPQGVQGPQGPTGAAITGAVGPQGNAGPTGSIGVTGPVGATGPRGSTGVQGPTGAAGSGGSAVTVVSLAADANANATTTGVEITGLAAALTAGRYVFKYVIRGRSSVTTTGLKFGVNYTGTTTLVVAALRQVGTGTSAITGTGDGVNTTAQIVEGFTARSLSTTAPNLGPTLGVDSANADLMYIIEGVIVVSTSGDLELWHASETAAATTVMTGSALILTKVG
jgi:hypothetical protein